MSGNSYVSDCPCCGSSNSLECSNDTRPIESVSGVCVVCGFQYWTQFGFADKETLEELRADQEYKPIPMTDEMKKRVAEYCASYGIKREEE
jgi:hypothetical protein